MVKQFCWFRVRLQGFTDTMEPSVAVSLTQRSQTMWNLWHRRIRLHDVNDTKKSKWLRKFKKKKKNLQFKRTVSQNLHFWHCFCFIYGQIICMKRLNWNVFHGSNDQVESDSAVSWTSLSQALPCLWHCGMRLRSVTDTEKFYMTSQSHGSFLSWPLEVFKWIVVWENK